MERVDLEGVSWVLHIIERVNSEGTIVKAQVNIPGDFLSLSCSRLEEEELQINIATTETIVLPSGQEVEKGYILNCFILWPHFFFFLRGRYSVCVFTFLIVV